MDFLSILVHLRPEWGSWKKLFSYICWYLRQSSICADCSDSHPDMHQHANSEEPISVQQTEIITTTELDLEELRPLSGEICRGKQLQKGLFFKFKDKQKKPSSSFGERRATPVSIICGIYYCREWRVCRSMYARRGGRNKLVRGRVSSSKQLKSWTEASSSRAGKPASENNDAAICLPLRQTELEKQMWGKGKNNKIPNAVLFPACKTV